MVISLRLGTRQVCVPYPHPYNNIEVLASALWQEKPIKYG